MVLEIDMFSMTGGMSSIVIWMLSFEKCPPRFVAVILIVLSVMFIVPVHMFSAPDDEQERISPSANTCLSSFSVTLTVIVMFVPFCTMFSETLIDSIIGFVS